MSSGRILVIDDSWVVLDTIRAALSAEGYDVRLATELASAKQKVASSDLCIIDFHMPGLDGKDVMTALRVEARGKSSCVFYLYTSDVDVARRYEALGFDGSFLKKGEVAQLAAQVSAVFRTIRMKNLAADLKKKRTSG